MTPEERLNYINGIKEKINNKDRLKLIAISEGLLNAKREGNQVDIPEGSKYIVMSDTLAKNIGNFLKEIVEKI